MPTLITPTGVTVTVDDSRVEALLKQGYKKAPEKKTTSARGRSSSKES